MTRKQKKHALKYAKKWLKFKVRVETPFKRELRSYFFQQSKEVRAGRDPESIASVLDKQYNRIAREMTGVRIKQEDEYSTEEKVILILSGLAAVRALNIDKTTKKLVDRSRELARQELANDGIFFPSAVAVNRIASQIFKNYTPGRTGAIAVSETQMLTEKLKTVKMEVAEDMMEDAIAAGNQALAQEAADMAESLTYQETAENIGEVPAAELFVGIRALEKTWVTVGDSKVRDAHKAANFQTVPRGEPFIVMGEFLMHPGDSSMGASAANLANCRCSSVIL